MGVELGAEASPEHIENHKAYVQSWIKEIRNKPESLIRAIKDAQQAADYMDMKAGLISEKDYVKACAGVMEVAVTEQRVSERPGKEILTNKDHSRKRSSYER